MFLLLAGVAPPCDTARLDMELNQDHSSVICAQKGRTDESSKRLWLLTPSHWLISHPSWLLTLLHVPHVYQKK